MGFNNHVYYKDDIKASAFGLVCEEKKLMTSDKIMINTYQVHAENPNGVIIMLTGIQWPDVKYYFSHAKLFLENGYVWKFIKTCIIITWFIKFWY